MLSKSSKENRSQIQMLSIDQLVPENHILRAVDQYIDFNFIYDLVEEYYCADTGRPSIDPVVLFKIAFLQYFYGIKSMRQTIQEIEVNLAYRWFLGYDFTSPIPHFSTFGKNYDRRYKDTDIFEQIFMHILQQCKTYGFVHTEEIFVDSTHVKAAANRRKVIKREVERQAKWYRKELVKEINADRKSHDKKPFDDDDPPKKATITTSSTDPESGLFHKGEHKEVFAYSIQTACDKNGWILGCEVYPGNAHDSITFKDFYDRQIKHLQPSYLIADAGYKTPAIAKMLIDDHILPVTPYTRPKSKERLLAKKEFIYDEYNDCYLCPENKILSYSTTTRDGNREYKSKPYICQSCPRLETCTKSQNKQKTILRHIWQDYIEATEDIRHTRGMRERYAKRKETIERLFGTAKEHHGMRYTNMKGKHKMKMKACLTFACMNAKKLVKLLRNRGLGTPLFFIFKHQNPCLGTCIGA